MSGTGVGFRARFQVKVASMGILRGTSDFSALALHEYRAITPRNSLPQTSDFSGETCKGSGYPFIAWGGDVEGMLVKDMT